MSEKVGQSYLLKYNAIAHLCLAVTYGISTISYFTPMFQYNTTNYDEMSQLWDKEFGRVAYFTGHLIISCTQLILSNNEDNIGDMRTMLLGMFGHSLLLIYGFWMINLSGLLFLNVFFSALQCGMIYFYASNRYPDMGVIPVQNIITRRDIYLCIFGSLFVYYVYMGSQDDSIKRYGLWMVAGVYAILFYLFYKQPVAKEKKRD